MYKFKNITHISISMSSLVNTILAKPNWESKIDDPKIIQKWKSELVKQGGKESYIVCVINLLKDYLKKKDIKDKYNDITNEKWSVTLPLNGKDVSIASECKCPDSCSNCHTMRSDSENENTDDPNITSKCKCTEKKLLEKKQKYLLTNVINKQKLITDDIKNTFMHLVEEHTNRIPVDYHPGSNDQVIDLVHPSLYCYVKGVTKILKGSQPFEKTGLFQWLPAEFEVGKGNVKIHTEIGNLPHVENRELYSHIATIFGKFVPLFEETIKKLANDKRIKFNGKISNCQVIVKLANTVLTPEKPHYPSGNWHLEGIPEEHIIATGIYYYEMQNISENYLEFRGTIDECNIDYPQNNEVFVKTHYGFPMADSEDNIESYIELGRIKTKEDMCIVFPNFLQHRVSDFELRDKTKIGTRKILVFFLIDPSKRILSTKDVRSQHEYVSLDDAKIYRELLMFQRKYEIKHQNEVFERGWMLCEH